MSVALAPFYSVANNDYGPYSLNCVHSHVRRLAQQQKVVRLRRDDGRIAWEVTEEGRLPRGETEVVGSHERTMEVPLLKGIVEGRGTKGT